MKILKNVSLRDRCTYRIGGNAQYYAEPKNQEDIFCALQFAQQNQIPFFILGKGSNLLISDNGWSGLVINLSDSYNKIDVNSDFAEAESGALLNSLINRVIENGFTGMEELAGIPGTVGGAVIMNAGAFNSCIADTLTSVRVYDYEKGSILELSSKELDLGYRTSSLKGTSAVILSARFEFPGKKEPDLLYAVRKEILEKRKVKQPLEYPNCGSVFKRPPGGFAGTMIESCGLKGLRIGDVEVSTRHANFIINRGTGTATDVRRLIKTIQIAVYERFGVILEPEVIFIGEYDEPLLQSSSNNGE